MDVAVFSAIFSVVMLALGSWCISEGVDILNKPQQNSSYLKGFGLSVLAIFPSFIVLVTALQSGNIDFGVNALTGAISCEPSKFT